MSGPGVTSMRLLFDDGTKSERMRPGKDAGAIDAAIRTLLAESKGRFSHRVQFLLADGTLVTVRPKAGDQ